MSRQDEPFCDEKSVKIEKFVVKKSNFIVQNEKIILSD